MEYEQHLLLGLDHLDQLVPEEVQDGAELVEAGMMPGGVSDGQEVGQTGGGLDVVDLGEVQQLLPE